MFRFPLAHHKRAGRRGLRSAEGADFYRISTVVRATIAPARRSVGSVPAGAGAVAAPGESLALPPTLFLVGGFRSRYVLVGRPRRRPRVLRGRCP